jgi:hypothetical protein
MTFLILASCAILAQFNAAAADTNYVSLPSQLTGWVASPGSDAIASFESAGMRDVRPHVLTSAELTRVEAALKALPALHRDVLGNRLRHLSFVDGIPGEGTGLKARQCRTARLS